jgi:hypothetical protein
MPHQGLTSPLRNDAPCVGDTPVGKGVFAQCSYPTTSIIGEIAGDIVGNGRGGSDYAFEIDDHSVLEPYAPFRFLNHRCEPNCEFLWFDDDAIKNGSAPLLLIALCDIQLGDELTIDYNWPASNAIACQCGAASCRGWIVGIDEMERLQSMHDGAIEK